MTRQSSSMGHRCRQLCTNANFTAFGSRRTAWPFLALPSPPGAHGSQGEDVHSHAPNLPAAQPSGQQADVAIPTCPASIYRHLAATVADRAACCRNCRKRETGGIRHAQTRHHGYRRADRHSPPEKRAGAADPRRTDSSPARRPASPSPAVRISCPACPRSAAVPAGGGRRCCPGNRAS